MRQTIFDYLLIAFASIMPQHFLSKMAHKLARSRNYRFKTFLIKSFCKIYPVNLAEAENPDIYSYNSFGEFFTRSLKAQARPIDEQANVIVCPVDGLVSQCGEIRHDRLLQAKGTDFSLTELLAQNESWAVQYHNGQFATIYLSPKDYHRIHMPFSAQLAGMTYVPGVLYPVNGSSSRLVSGLYARNERLVCHYVTEFGPMSMVLVGAMLVSGIETTVSGVVTPPYGNQIRHYTGESSEFDKGDEMGRFNYGSTVIMLLPSHLPELTLTAGQVVKMGQKIGVVN